MSPAQSWVIRERTTGRVVCETFSASVVAALKTEVYEAVPIRQYLEDLNTASRLAALTGKP